MGPDPFRTPTSPPLLLTLHTMCSLSSCLCGNQSPVGSTAHAVHMARTWWLLENHQMSRLTCAGRFLCGKFPGYLQRLSNNALFVFCIQGRVRLIDQERSPKVSDHHSSLLYTHNTSPICTQVDHYWKLVLLWWFIFIRTVSKTVILYAKHFYLKVTNESETWPQVTDVHTNDPPVISTFKSSWSLRPWKTTQNLDEILTAQVCCP